jgi:hypothetical protein
MVLGFQDDFSIAQGNLDSVIERWQFVRRELNINDSTYYLSHSTFCHGSLLIIL